MTLDDLIDPSPGEWMSDEQIEEIKNHKPRSMKEWFDQPIIHQDPPLYMSKEAAESLMLAFNSLDLYRPPTQTEKNRRKRQRKKRRK